MAASPPSRRRAGRTLPRIRTRHSQRPWLPGQDTRQPEETIGKGERVDRAVRAALVRVSLIDRVNHVVTVGLAPDAHRVELLQMLRPLVLSGRVDVSTESRWVEHAKRLRDEAQLWQAAARLIGSRYLAGESPLFPGAAADLESLRASCEELLADYNAAASRPGGRKPKGEPVDLRAGEERVAELVELHTTELVRLARRAIEVMLGERNREITISRLIELGERRS